MKQKFADRMGVLQRYLSAGFTPDGPTATSRRQSQGGTPAEMAQAQAIEAAQKQAEDQAQAARERADAQAALDAAQGRFDGLHEQKQELTKLLNGFEDLGPLPAIEPTNPHSIRAKGRSGNPESQRRIAEELDAESAKIEGQLPLLREEEKKRRDQAIRVAKQVYLQNSKVQIPEVTELDALIAASGPSADAALKAYQSAKQLDATLKQFAVTKQRANTVLASAEADIAAAAKYSTDREAASAARAATQAANALSVKTQSILPHDGPRISQLTDKLVSEQSRVKALTRQAAAMSTSVGRRVYDGCYAWAKRNGLASSVRVFKDVCFLRPTLRDVSRRSGEQDQLIALTMAISQHSLPRRPSTPSLAIIGIITSPANGSAYHPTNSAFRSKPPRRF
jgi:hypothetical protein